VQVIIFCLFFAPWTALFRSALLGTLVALFDYSCASFDERLFTTGSGERAAQVCCEGTCRPSGWLPWHWARWALLIHIFLCFIFAVPALATVCLPMSLIHGGIITLCFVGLMRFRLWVSANVPPLTTRDLDNEPLGKDTEDGWVDNLLALLVPSDEPGPASNAAFEARGTRVAATLHPPFLACLSSLFASGGICYLSRDFTNEWVHWFTFFFNHDGWKLAFPWPHFELPGLPTLDFDMPRFDLTVPDLKRVHDANWLLVVVLPMVEFFVKEAARLVDAGMEASGIKVRSPVRV